MSIYSVYISNIYIIIFILLYLYYYIYIIIFILLYLYYYIYIIIFILLYLYYYIYEIFIYFIIEELTILCSARATRTEHVELQAIEEQKVQHRRWRRRKKINVAVVLMWWWAELNKLLLLRNSTRYGGGLGEEGDWGGALTSAVLSSSAQALQQGDDMSPLVDFGWLSLTLIDIYRFDNSCWLFVVSFFWLLCTQEA